MKRIKSTVLCDFYKVGHPFQYPDNTTMVYSNLTARGSRLAGVNRMIFFGLNYFIKEYLIDNFNKTFFEKPLEEVLAHYKRRMRKSLFADLQSYKHIEDLHALGYLPLCIKAVPEGTYVDMKVPCLLIYNTDQKFGWLPNFIETILSNTIWQPITSATIARHFRNVLEEFAKRTVSKTGDISFVKWQGHDFSMRGMGHLGSACTSGGGHLLSFWGTDTIPAIEWLEDYYGAGVDEDEIVGGSVPATEHSVMCMGGKESERETILRLITKVYPTGPVSIVSDTWDFFKTISSTALSLKSEILARDGKVIFRPDSGIPQHIVAGYRDDEVRSLGGNQWLVVKGKNVGKEISNIEKLGTIQVLYDIFGGTLTEQGYKLLDGHVGCIYGDGITTATAQEILERLEEKGFCSFNIVFGMGSFSYQYNTRDTLGMAMKATAGEVENKVIQIFKDPKTDDGLKKSAKGFIRVDKEPILVDDGYSYLIDDGDYKLVMTDQVSWEEQEGGLMQDVFKDGKLLIDPTLKEIRKELKF